MTKRPITVVIRENTSPLPPVSPWPLIYTVEVEGYPEDGEILDLATKARMSDLSVDDCTRNAWFKVFRDGIELLFCFEGDLMPLIDWRNA